MIGYQKLPDRPGAQYAAGRRKLAQKNEGWSKAKQYLAVDVTVIEADRCLNNIT